MKSRIAAALAVLAAGCSTDLPATGTSPEPARAGAEVVVVGERPLALEAPLAHDNLVIYLLTGDATDDREFLTLDQGLEGGKVIVSEKGAGGDGAEVNELLLDNQSDRWLFLQAGDVVLGGKQDRAVAQDVVVPPKSGPRPMAAFCVEHGRWSADADADGVLFTSNHSLVNSADLKVAIQAEQSQQSVWNEVAEAQMEIAIQPASTGTYRALVDHKEVAAKREAYASALLGKVRDAKDAVGMVVAINGEVVGLECYASPGLFRAMARKLVDSYALDALTAREKAKAGTPAPSPDAVRAFAAAAAGRAGKEDALPGDMRRIVLDGDVMVGFEYRCRGPQGEGTATPIHASYLRK